MTTLVNLQTIREEIARKAMESLATELTQLGNDLGRHDTSIYQLKSVALLTEAAEAARHDNDLKVLDKLSAINKRDSRWMMSIAKNTGKRVAGNALECAQMLNE